MRKSLLRDYLIGLVLACSPVLPAGCGTDDGDLSDGGIDAPIFYCNPDMPKAASLTATVSAADGGVGDCHDACVAALTKAGAPFRPDEVTCDEDVDAGTQQVVCRYLAPSGCGRAPAGLAAPRPSSARDMVGAYLARAAHLEAASVLAFRRLAVELEAHEAPISLVRRARAAANDERRHARAMRALARRRGAVVPAVEVAPFVVRSLEALAHENAVAGQVEETYGAVVALHQARTTRLPDLRRTMQAIAGEELAHAELSWDVARWAERRLSSAARGRLRKARRAAAKRLSTTVEALPADARAELGLPDPSQARALLERLSRDLLR